MAQRKVDILKRIKKNGKIVVMFAGVAPFPIIIGRTLKQNKIEAKIVSSELNLGACEFAEENVKLNNLTGCVDVVS